MWFRVCFDQRAQNPVSGFLFASFSDTQSSWHFKNKSSVCVKNKFKYIRRSKLEHDHSKPWHFLYIDSSFLSVLLQPFKQRKNILRVLKQRLLGLLVKHRCDQCERLWASPRWVWMDSYLNYLLPLPLYFLSVSVFQPSAAPPTVLAHRSKELLSVSQKTNLLFGCKALKLEEASISNSEDIFWLWRLFLVWNFIFFLCFQLLCSFVKSSWDLNE